MSSDEEDNAETIICDTEEGYLKSLDDLVAQSAIDKTEPRQRVEHKATLPAAPDGGYAWVVCIGVFINHMLIEGFGRAEGLFFLQFQSKFETSAQLAAWPSSLMSAVRLCLGPVAGALVNRYSVRTACIIGTLLCFTGMLLNSFAPNVYFLFLSHTLLGGLGRGLMSGILLLNLYFDKHRSMANGLAMSGIGFGSLWTVPLAQFLFDEYGFTGAFMVISAILLHGLVVAMIFRPLRVHYRFLTAKLLRKGVKTTAAEDETPVSTHKTSDGGSRHQDMTRKDFKLQEKLLTVDENVEQLPNNEPAAGTPLMDETTAGSKGDNASKSSASSLSEDDEDALKISETKSMELETPAQEKMSSSERKKENQDGCLRSFLKICFPVEFKRSGGTKQPETFHWELFKNFPFIIYCLANLFYLLAYRITFIFLPAIATSKGLSRQEAALMLTIVGAVETVGRIVTGFIMDLRYMRPFRSYFFTIFLFLVSVTTAAIPLAHTTYSLGIVCAVYGFLLGAFVTQKLIVLIDILGRDKLTSSLGIQKLFLGIGALVGPPLAGALRDSLGNYDVSFYVGGASLFGSAMLMTVGTIMLTLRNRKSSI